MNICTCRGSTFLQRNICDFILASSPVNRVAGSGSIIPSRNGSWQCFALPWSLLRGVYKGQHYLNLR